MSLTSLPLNKQALLNPALLGALLGELQGLNVDVVDGAAAGTAMTIAGIKPNDTIVAAIKLTDTWSAPTNDKANITIQPVRASGTLTISGNPVDGETFVVNGNTYTFKTTPTRANHVKITAGNNTTMAAAAAAAINAYEGRYESQLNGDGNRKAGVVATSSAGVVTITAATDGAGNGPVVTGTVTVLAATNSGTAQATLTCATVVANNTFTVKKLDGTVLTFTAKATPTADTEFALKGTDALQATEIARAINYYDQKYGTLGVSAAAVGSAVNITSDSPRTGNTITLTESATNVTVSGSGTLAGGTDTGSIKSTTDLSVATLVVIWFNKP